MAEIKKVIMCDVCKEMLAKQRCALCGKDICARCERQIKFKLTAELREDESTEAWKLKNEDYISPPIYRSIAPVSTANPIISGGQISTTQSAWPPHLTIKPYNQVEAGTSIPVCRDCAHKHHESVFLDYEAFKKFIDEEIERIKSKIVLKELEREK